MSELGDYIEQETNVLIPNQKYFLNGKEVSKVNKSDTSLENPLSLVVDNSETFKRLFFIFHEQKFRLNISKSDDFSSLTLNIEKQLGNLGFDICAEYIKLVYEGEEVESDISSIPFDATLTIEERSQPIESFGRKRLFFTFQDQSFRINLSEIGIEFKDTNSVKSELSNEDTVSKLLIHIESKLKD